MRAWDSAHLTTNQRRGPDQPWAWIYFDLLPYFFLTLNVCTLANGIVASFSAGAFYLDYTALGNMTKTQNRDANHLRWQKSTSLGIRVPEPEYRKMEHRETLWWGCCCKKRENHYVSRRWHPSFKSYAKKGSPTPRPFSTINKITWVGPTKYVVQKIYAFSQTVCLNSMMVACLASWRSKDY